ncbi:hypothetical protein TNCV_4520891 [Trichonephila clavipes]|nr:hypothetical protein TNCV_4520891 [Trichonephila clavipes]
MDWALRVLRPGEAQKASDKLVLTRFSGYKFRSSGTKGLVDLLRPEPEMILNRHFVAQLPWPVFSINSVLTTILTNPFFCALITALGGSRQGHLLWCQCPGSNTREGMDAYKCIGPVRHRSTLNIRAAEGTVEKLVKWSGRPRIVLPKT